MSQPAPAPAPADAPAPAAQQPAAGAPAVIPAPRPGGRTVVDTPALLNRWQLIGMTIAIVFGIISALLQFLAWQSDGRAADDTEQLTRVQRIQSNLLHANALATNEFLVGGQGDTDLREQYDEAMASVLADITDAAEAQPADRKALSALSEAVNEYATGVADARVYNRQGYPVGAEYLSEASNSLDTYALVILANLVDANTERAEGSMDGQHPLWLLLVGIAALAGLWWVNRLLAQRFRRRINKGVAVAAILVLLVTVVGTLAAWRGDDANDNLADGALRVAINEAAARTAGNDAKALESLRLIKRGSGSLYEDPEPPATGWTDAAAIVEEKASGSTLRSWRAYVDRHEEIVKLDDSDFWIRAKNIAVSTGEDGSTPPFDTFDEDSEDIIADKSEETTESLRSGRTLALIGSGLTLLLGLAAAIAVARGIGERRKEYA